MALETSGIAKGAADGKKALADLEKAVGDVATETGKSGNKVDSFASKLVDASRKAGKADDEIRDALRQMGLSAKDADRALDRMGDTAQDAGREGADGVDKLEKELKDVQSQSDSTAQKVDGVGEAAKSTGIKMNRAMGTDIRQGINAVGDLLDGRVAGGMNNLLNATTSVSQHLPIVGVGIAAAAGLAAPALAALTEEQEKQNAAVQRLKGYFADAWQEAVAGGRTYIDQMTVLGEMQDIMFNTDRADEYKRIQEDANALSLDTSTLLRAAAGDEDALNQVRDRSIALLDAQEQKIRDTQANLKSGQEAELDALHQQEDAIRSVNDRWGEYGAINDENREKAAAAAAYTSQYLLDTIANADSATRAVDDFGNVLITLPDGKEIVIDAKTGKATTDVSKFKKDTDGVIDHLNARDIVLQVKAAVRDAQNEVNRFVASNDGRSFRLHGRVTVDSGAL
ncbi:hypothetical protein [Microbacterium paludicola]|uniref:hypothetical protein n=1 Tax=Microbacterium paludicola TaxID=300019 RepID=UPI001642627B|nr:hypothetical protein [Microbacterium paludicola]